jgi:hypothetical protein
MVVLPCPCPDIGAGGLILLLFCQLRIVVSLTQALWVLPSGFWNRRRVVSESHLSWFWIHLSKKNHPNVGKNHGLGARLDSP